MPPARDEAHEALRQIIEANYKHAAEKYGDDFDFFKVNKYECVTISKLALCNKGYAIMVESL